VIICHSHGSPATSGGEESHYLCIWLTLALEILMRSSPLRLLGAVSLVAAFLGPVSFSRADITASFNLGGGTLTQTQANAIGWEFTVTDFIAVSSLGVWDSAGDGLSKVHNVGIFRVSDNSLVIGAVLIDGSHAPLVDGSRFVNVAPTTLSPGVPYYIMADDFTADPFVSGSGSMGFAPEINWLALADSNAASIFSTPTFIPGALGNLGPNFQYTVPGPGAIALLGLGTLLFGARCRR
jgi:hypothetical protein